MKTLKFALIAAIIACTTVSLAYTESGIQDNSGRVVCVSFEKALLVPGLPTAMHEQLTAHFLNPYTILFTQTVFLNGINYQITGTYYQWYMFFYGPWYSTTVPDVFLKDIE